MDAKGRNTFLLDAQEDVEPVFRSMTVWALSPQALSLLLKKKKKNVYLAHFT